jgi:hypothetical protein
MVTPQDDFPHPIPPQAFMTWKENWVFPAVDRDNRSSALFHFSLRPVLGEGIFTAKFHVDGTDYRHVSRSPVPRDLRDFHPIADDHVTFTIVEPGREFRLQHSGPEVEADLVYRARWPVWDFEDGPRVEGSTLGEVGNTVFPFHHFEQALAVTGTITLKTGDQAGQTVEFSGLGNRDHSWGFRDDFQFRHHHWLCANFEKKFVQGSVMLETSYPEEKTGGWVSTDAGNLGVQTMDTSGAYWLVPGEPLGDPREDVTYRLTTVEGDIHVITAHLGEDYGRLFLNARSEDRSEIYMDVQIFCDFTDEETSERGVGVLELGKYLSGDGVADKYGRRPA